jgi:hypothetical protein
VLSAVLLYSSLLFFSREVEYIWRRPRQITTWLYVLYQYPGVLAQVIWAVIVSTVFKAGPEPLAAKCVSLLAVRYILQALTLRCRYADLFKFKRWLEDLSLVALYGLSRLLEKRYDTEK